MKFILLVEGKTERTTRRPRPNCGRRHPLACWHVARRRYNELNGTNLFDGERNMAEIAMTIPAESLASLAATHDEASAELRILAAVKHGGSS